MRGFVSYGNSDREYSECVERMGYGWSSALTKCLTGRSPYYFVRIWDPINKKYFTRSRKETIRIDARQVAQELFLKLHNTTSQAIVNMFCNWYRKFGLLGCSSHIGRRTFITETSKKISLVGGSLRDIQMMVGHSSLQTTQRYIEADSESQKKVVDLI